MKWVPWLLKAVRSESRSLNFLGLGILFYESAKFSRGLVFALGVKSCFPSTDGKLCWSQLCREGRLPVPLNLNFRNKANRNTVFCTESNIEGRNHPAGLHLLWFFFFEGDDLFGFYKPLELLLQCWQGVLKTSTCGKGQKAAFVSSGCIWSCSKSFSGHCGISLQILVLPAP